MKTRLLIFLVLAALLIRVVALATHPFDKTPWSDGAQYVNLGISIADGNGYVLKQGNFWPGQPTLVRAPGWPMVLAGAFRVFQGDTRWPVARVMAVILDAGNCLLLLGLALAIGLSWRSGYLIALLYALNPVAASMCVVPASEPLAIFLLLLFTVLVARFSRQQGNGLLWAGLALGAASLVRPNFILIAALFSAGYLWSKRVRLRSTLALLVVFNLVVAAPLIPWVVRNAVVFHQFPLLGAGRGETFYGGNNDLAAEVGGYYEGYIVQPGELLKDKPLYLLASQMNEAEVDAYLFKKGVDWVKTHPQRISRLVLLKLKRAYLPVPRTRGMEVLMVSAYRWAIYVLACLGVILYLRSKFRIPQGVAIALSAIAIGHVFVTVIFCGVYRYAFSGEVFLLVPAGVGLSFLLNWGAKFAKSEPGIAGAKKEF